MVVVPPWTNSFQLRDTSDYMCCVFTKVMMVITVPLENTCYLKTGLAGSWAEARSQCWAWGGELALPLTSNTSTPNSWLQVSDTT